MPTCAPTSTKSPPSASRRRQPQLATVVQARQIVALERFRRSSRSENPPGKRATVEPDVGSGSRQPQPPLAGELHPPQHGATPRTTRSRGRSRRQRIHGLGYDRDRCRNGSSPAAPGFIGANTIVGSRGRGIEVDRRRQPLSPDVAPEPRVAGARARRRLPARPGRPARLRGDRSRRSRAHADADVVLHLAGQVAVTTSVSSPRDDFEANALGTFNALEATRAHLPHARS